MLKYIITTGAGICIVLLIYTELQLLYNLRSIKYNKIFQSCILYEDIFSRFIVPESFLRMKNRGDNLCEDTCEIQYIDYKFDSLFM